MMQSPAGNGVSSSGAAVAEEQQWRPAGDPTAASALLTSSSSPSWSPFPTTAAAAVAASLSNGRSLSSDMKRLPDHLVGTPDSARKRPRKSESDLRLAKLNSGRDFCCWVCHKEKATHSCRTCVRSFHVKCQPLAAGQQPLEDQKFVCSECELSSGLTTKPVRALRSLTAEELNGLILDIVRDAKQIADPSFHVPVQFENYPDYKEKIIHPVSFQDLEKKCADNLYKTPHAMLSDLQWIYHNCVIYNSASHALTTNAKQFIKRAGGQVVDLEICPDCFKNHSEKPQTWFTETCRKPHLLVIARVAGWPFWPAKLVDINRLSNFIEVRFFGAGHERCFLLSEKDCLTVNNKAKGSKAKLEASLKELRDHISKLETRFNFKYPYAPPKTAVDPRKLFVRVRDDEPEDLLSDVEPEADPLPEAGDQAPPDSPDDAPLQIDEGTAAPAATVADSNNGSEQGKTVPSVPAAFQPLPPLQPQQQDIAIQDPVSSSAMNEVVNKSDQPKGAPVQRNKIAQNLKKTLESRRSQSLSASDAEDGAAPCAADAARIKQLKSEIASLKRELNMEKVAHMRAMELEKKRLDTAIADLQREKDQTLAKEASRLKREHEENLRHVKQKQWCAQCDKMAQFYCCWNTSYCSVSCQHLHWEVHLSSCQQRQTMAGDNNVA